MAEARHIVLIQLGTPDAPTTPAVRRYLREFLSDAHVVGLPRWLWLPILYGPILTFRPRKSAALYRSIWMPEGSPLLVNTVRLADGLQSELGDGYRVHVAMRYGSPSMEEVLRPLADSRPLVVPLFPQYTDATTGSVLDRARELIGEPLDAIEHYAAADEYLDALGAVSSEGLAAIEEPERILLSFHGIPKRRAVGDPYYAQCEATAHALAERLELPSERWEMTFQSRFGPEKWLEPATDRRLEALGREGVRSVAVICPGFASDCLETLEEIAKTGQEQFRAEGGERLHLVPCLNHHPHWVVALAQIVRRHDR